jgi:hypothetical protein
MKPKAKTLIEKHGFIDPDRKAGQHDKIQIWAYRNLSTILKSLAHSDREFTIQYACMEKPIMQIERNYTGVVGFVDLYLSGYVTRSDEKDKPQRIDVSIEVKGTIESCGDLIRQINFYRKFESIKSTWIVVSPDDRFKEILKDQNIYFFKYKDPVQLF